MRVSDIYNFVDQLAPFNNILEGDNVGLLVGNIDKTVEKILVSLDITKKVVLEAVRKKCDLIISHHPVIFDPLVSLKSDEIAYMLARNDISAICSHTCLDLAVNGVNDALARAVGIIGSLEWLSLSGEQQLGRIGQLGQSYTPEEYAEFVKKALNANNVKYCSGEKKIRRVAVIGGSGGSDINRAIECGADAFVTADTKYNNFLDATDANITLIDAGHFATENVVIKPLVHSLKQKFPKLEIFISDHSDIIKGV